jgi:hypothetical protein
VERDLHAIKEKCLCKCESDGEWWMGKTRRVARKVEKLTVDREEIAGEIEELVENNEELEN